MIDCTWGGRGVRRHAVALACLLGFAAPASADSLSAHYTVSLLGLHVGDLYAEGSFAPQAYHMNLNAHLSGIATLVANTKLALSSSGTMRKGIPLPSAYATSTVNSNDTRTLRMALSAGNVKALEISPPPVFFGERVPITEGNKIHVLDPTSALIMPVPAKESLTGPAACNRTLPIYDGYARFDVALHYEGEQDMQTGGYSGPVALCSARYRPISGHIVNSRSTAFMAANDRIQVWLAPIEHAHVVVPIKVSLPTMSGQAEIEAVEFNATTTEASTGTH